VGLARYGHAVQMWGRDAGAAGKHNSRAAHGKSDAMRSDVIAIARTIWEGFSDGHTRCIIRTSNMFNSQHVYTLRPDQLQYTYLVNMPTVYSTLMIHNQGFTQIGTSNQHFQFSTSFSYVRMHVQHRVQASSNTYNTGTHPHLTLHPQGPCHIEPHSFNSSNDSHQFPNTPRS
jgi:hypothetical protein